MGTFIALLANPVSIIVIALIAIIGFMISPYEIHFEDKEEIEI